MPIPFNVVQHEYLSSTVRKPCDSGFEVQRQLGRRASGRNRCQSRVIRKKPVSALTQNLPASQDHVHCEAMEPGSECCLAAIGGELLPDSDKYVLGDFVGIFVVQHSPDQ